jgi:photosystem II stability/assembly factor-like uncharacterized protein
MPNPRLALPRTAILLLLSALAALPRPAAAVAWTAIGPAEGPAEVVRVAPSAPRSLYAASSDSGGIFRSTDGGAHWRDASGDLPDQRVLDLAVDPRDADAAWAAVVDPPRVYRTADGGAHWTEVPGAPETGFVTRLVFDPRDPARVWAAATNGLFRSDDGGPFAPAGLAGVEVASLVFAPPDANDPQLLYAGVLGAVYRSADGGATWARTAGSSPLFDGILVRSLTIDPALPGSLFAIADRYVYRTDDQGVSWSRLPAAPDNPTVLAAAPSGGLWTSTYDRLFKSDDGGATWTESAPFGSHFVVTLAFDPRFPETLFLGTGYGLLKSRDGGGHWRPLPLKTSHVKILVTAPGAPATLYAGLREGWMRVSRDGGASWQPVTLGLSEYERNSIRAVTVDPHDPAAVWLLAGSTLAHSRDGGAHWTRQIFPGSYNSYLIAVDPVSPDTLYVGGEETSDHYDHGCFSMKTTDAGRHWRCLPAGEYKGAVAIDPRQPDDVYTAAYGAVRKTTDGGRTWHRVGRGLPLEVLTVTVDPARSGRLYAGTDAGVFKSTDGGRTWQAARAGLPPGRVVSVIVHPSRSSVVYAGIAAAGVFRSADGGRTWTRVGTGFPAQAFTGVLALAGGSGETLYAATDGRGVWKIDP